MSNQDDRQAKDSALVELAEQNRELSETLLRLVSKCEDAREFSAVARLAISRNELELASTVLTVLIDRLDPMLAGYYSDVSDEELVDIVKEKMENPAKS